MKTINFQHDAAVEIIVIFTCATIDGPKPRAIWVEVPVILAVEYFPGEPMTPDCPGCPAETRIVEAWYNVKESWLELALKSHGGKVENLNLPSLIILSAEPVDMPIGGIQLIELVEKQWPAMEKTLLEKGRGQLDYEMERCSVGLYQ